MLIAARAHVVFLFLRSLVRYDAGIWDADVKGPPPDAHADNGEYVSNWDSCSFPGLCTGCAAAPECESTPLPCARASDCPARPRNLSCRTKHAYRLQLRAAQASARALAYLYPSATVLS